MLNSFTDKVGGRVSRALSKVFATSPDTQSPAATTLTHPVVLNSNDDRLTGELLDLLLQTIFGSDRRSFEYVRRRIDTAAAGGTISEVEATIQRIVDDARNTNAPEASSLSEAMDSHKRRTQANQRAYSIEGRANPDAVFWPNPLNKQHPRSLANELPYVRNTPLVDRKTAIVSMGSCFAMEIAFALQRDGYNYVVTEPNIAADKSYWLKDSEKRPYAMSSAAWGTHFNCPSFLQVVEKAFGYRRPAKILWTNMSNGEVVYCDPFREEVEFPSVEAFEANYDKHIEAAQKALTAAEVLIITLGLNEVWYFKPDGSVFSRSPWRTAPSLVEHRVLTVEENVRDLQRMLDILREHNPKIKVLVTLSPVPLHATFLADNKHIVDANTHSKAVLRVAAEEFVSRNRDVYYFPSFELITSCLEKPWAPDERHVTEEAVAQVMKLFKMMYVRD